MQSAGRSVAERLRSARRDLIETSSRTRLLSARFDGSANVEIVTERCDEVFRILVLDGRSMTLAPLRARSGAPAATAPGEERRPSAPQELGSDGPSGDADGIPAQPELAGERGGDESRRDAADPRAADAAQSRRAEEDDAPAPHQLDAILQSDLEREALERRLRRMQYEARSQAEEQGLSTLHLAIGFLEWREREDESRSRHAPLLLVPVELERSRAGGSFRVAATGDGVVDNLSLAERLRADLGIVLPPVEPDAEGFRPSAWFAAVEAVIRERAGWRVKPHAMLLGFFSFARLLMYRDLDPEAWPQERAPDRHPMVEGLLCGAMPEQPPSIVGDDDFVDAALPPERCLHVVDADSSQTIAIADVVHGRRSIVVQGPPGTGKSQTIANIVAGAVAEGQRVLFVAEKRAALEVVKRRLDAIGLGPTALELHSTKANRRAVLRELGETLELGRPRTPDLDAQRDRLRDAQARLNAHADFLHAIDPGTGLSLHEIVGRIARLEAQRAARGGAGGAADAPRWRTILLEGDAEWDAAAVGARRDEIEALAARIDRGGPPAAHPFRGVGLDALLPREIEELSGRVAEVEEGLAEIERIAGAVGPAIGAPFDAEVRPEAEADALAARTRSPEGLRAALAALEHLGSVPPAAPLPLDAALWSQRRDEAAALVAALEDVGSRAAALGPRLAPGAEELDAAALRATIAAGGRSPLRLLSPAWWAARRAVAGMVLGAPPRSASERLALLDELIGLREARRRLAELDGPRSLGGAAFGSAWAGERSDATALRALLTWVDRGREAGLPAWFVALRPGSAARSSVDLASASRATQQAIERLDALAESLALDCRAAFGVQRLAEAETGELRARMAEWRSAPRRIEEAIDCRRRLEGLRTLGLGALAALLERGAVAPGDAVQEFEHAFLERQFRRLDPEGRLLRFDAEDHEALRRRFVELDRERIALARAEVALRHWERLPKSGETLGQMGLIRREIQKKSRHLPLRRILSEAGESIQRIKPVFMMSPSSVAQFLAPGGIEFDLLLFDEASQVRPVEALGSIARLAREGRLVVVGDQRQLPPTAFFRFESDLTDDDEGDEGGTVRDLESILGVAVAAGLPSRMLRWHYRSEHHSLIAVSNRLFYEERLHVVPSPFDRGPRHGLWMEHLTGTIFERGAGATNRGEARAVAEAVLAHARTTPEWTLGVGTFSIRQRDAILDEIETLRRADPATEAFFAEGGPEPFFVKNLENIQGDERDVIFISVGYGRDAEGRITMNFGPLSRDGGERRLNVLATRAKRRCVVFSSITDDQIDPNRATGAGAHALRAFLRYARLGMLDAEQGAGAERGRDRDAPVGAGGSVERDVAETIAECGYAADRRIGVGGFRVDIAVRDPILEDRYLLAVETDGPAYRDARSARDRERTRPAVLEARGWSLHRLHAAEWFRARDAATRSVLGAIERRARGGAGAVTEPESTGGGGPGRSPSAAPTATRSDGESPATQPAASATAVGAPAAGAKASHSLPSASRSGPASSPPLPTSSLFEREAASEVEDAMTIPYVLARLRVPSRRAPDEIPGDRLREIVAGIVEQEGPIHEDELERRMVNLWGMRRTTRAMQQAVQTGIVLAQQARSIERRGHFLDRPEALRRAEPRPPRNRSSVESATLRRPEMLPPEEVRELVRLVVEGNLGIAREDVIRETRRRLGFGSTSAALRELIEAQLDALVTDGAVEARGGGYAAVR